MGADFKVMDVLSRSQDCHREVQEHAAFGPDFLFTGEGHREPNQDRQRQREELQPEILEHQIAQESDHLAMPLVADAADESPLATSVRPGSAWSLSRNRSQPNPLRERAGL